MKVHVRATLTQEADGTTHSHTAEDTQEGFSIHGENPAWSRMRSILSRVEYQAVAWQESSHRQFTGTRYTGSGSPLYGPPDGWGAMQLELDTNRPAGKNWGEEEIWNWRANVGEGVKYLEEIRSAAVRYFRTHYNRASSETREQWSWNPNNPGTQGNIHIWDDTFARYNTGDPIHSPNGNFGHRKCSGQYGNPNGCAYADRVRGHINSRPW